MDRETFDRIFSEEGVNSVELRQKIWDVRPDDLCEDSVRVLARVCFLKLQERERELQEEFRSCLVLRHLLN